MYEYDNRWSYNSNIVYVNEIKLTVQNKIY